MNYKIIKKGNSVYPIKLFFCCNDMAKAYHEAVVYFNCANGEFRINDEHHNLMSIKFCPFCGKSIVEDIKDGVDDSTNV